ncbi:HAD family hydrolase [Psychromonas antarctica]|jgi:HAD superfamily hydrolase (TIGR01509 family)|uniref:HAD family hydrolase n=1 Tax=Psychromonas antarctica TaxID=67573 RepID=UPI001EE8EE52|nr:HAD family phosphatase [Psychromonas antarctica]MCG6200054.1 HAD family phosphatase [Psychromonas antarctica]
MNYQAAVFDMDGLLLDTERVCQQAFRDACISLSLPMLEEVYLGIIGCNAEGIKEVICNGYGADLDYEALRVEWMGRYHPIVEQQAIPVKEGVIALLNYLKAQQIPIAVATSTHKELAITKLKLAGLLEYFEQISAGCEVTHGKPSPEIFLLAAKRLNTLPQQCLAFEDSSNGVRAAMAAGMQVYHVPDLVRPSDDIIALGHTISDSLTDALDHLKARNN